VSHGDRILRFLASAGGVPGLATVVLGILCLIGLAEFGVGAAEKVAIGLGSFADPQDALLAFTVVCVLLAVLLLIAPVCIYVMVGQNRRLEVIKGYYSSGLIARYFDQFWSGRDGFSDLITRWRNRVRLPPDPLTNLPVINGVPLTSEQVSQIQRSRDELTGHLKQAFSELLKEDFGFAIYMVPLVLLTAVAVIIMYFGFLGGISLAKTWAVNSGAANPVAIPLFGIKFDLVSIAAIFGAYTWVTSDSITHNYQSTFHPSDLSWYALRLIIAIPLGEAISMLSLGSGTDLAAKGSSVLPGWGAFLAFVISMFSLDSIVKYLSAAAKKFTNIQPGSAAERDNLVVRLPGVDEETARRLTTEGVSTIAQLVSVDPVRLSIRAGLPFDFVVGLIDAAILWTYVGNKIAIVREFGFKGASNVLLYAEIRSEKAHDVSMAYVEAETARGTAKSERDVALHALRSAQLAIDTNSDIRTKQQRLQEIDTRLADPVTNEAEKNVLSDEKQRLERELADIQHALDNRLQIAKAASEDASAKYDEALKKAASATETLLNLLKNPGILQDLASKAGMTESGFDNIVQQLTQDEYADFIRALMGAARADA
jgi:hypothetical protein